MNTSIPYTHCACCGEPLDIIEQQVIRRLILVTCNNGACPMFGFTDGPVQHQQNAAKNVQLFPNGMHPLRSIGKAS